MGYCESCDDDVARRDLTDKISKLIKETKEESIKKHFIVDGVYIPQLECKKLAINQSKLRSEERILDRILR